MCANLKNSEMTNQIKLFDIKIDMLIHETEYCVSLQYNIAFYQLISLRMILVKMYFSAKVLWI